LVPDRRSPPSVASWSRLLEWALVAGVIVALGLALGRQTREIQAKAELAAVQYTLGSLRTALVIAHLQQRLGPGNTAVASPQRNPFDLLQQRPANYAGEFTLSANAQPPPGSWVFDPACPCVGYRPLEDPWPGSPGGQTMAWFDIIGAPGPLQLNARETYVWRGQPLL
jgi:hypothetical protein